MNRKWGAAALVAAAMVLMSAGGCGCQQKTAKNNAQPPSDSAAEPDKTFTDPLSGEPVKITAPKVIPAPGTRGWKEVNQTAKKTSPADLGAKMDKALRGLDKAWGEYQISYRYQGSQLNGSGEFLFDDKGEFWLEYFLPKTETQRFLVVGNGKQRAMMDGKGWHKLGEVGDTSGASAGSPDPDKWATDFMEEMISYYRDGRDAWQPIISRWSKDPNYKVTMEEASRKVKDKTNNLVDRPFYRLVIDSKKTGDQMEIIVDGKRYLPLTVKSIMNDKQDQLFWTVQWAFGGNHPDEKFKIPDSV